MVADHWYVLQSALNMVALGAEIMPRYWSAGIGLEDIKKFAYAMLMIRVLSMSGGFEERSA